MKKIISILCAAMMTLSVVEANVLYNEHFDRPVGTLSTSTWSSGAIPNDSNWHTYAPGSVQFQVVSQQLQKTDYCTASSGKAVQYSANHSRDYILFPQAFNGVAGNKVYMAFLMKVNANGLQETTGAQSASNANNSIMSFAINASNNALGSLNGRVIIQTVDASHYKLGVSRRGEAPQFASQQLSTNATYLIVAEYCFIAGEKNDIVNLYIDPTPAAQTVAVASVNPSTASADTETLVGMALCSNGSTPVDMLIDEVRVATSWDELWEDSSAPTPSIDVASSLNFYEVTVGETAERNLPIQGSNLQGAISISSDKTELVPLVTIIPKEDAEAGFTVMVILTATKEGAGTANLTLSSPGASDQIVVVSWDAKKPVPPVGSELLENGSFEEFSYNAMFATYSFDDWNFPLGYAAPVTEDKLDGQAAFQGNPNINSVLDQGVTLDDNTYAAGTLFELTLHYKVVEISEGTSLGLDCYWQPSGSGDADAMKQHDAAVLQRSIATEVSSEWKEVVLTTSKPVGSTYFRVRVTVPQNAKVLFDDFSLVRTESAEPYILVSPNKFNPIETTIGSSVAFPTLHIEQGNLEGPTAFELSYTNADQFSLSMSSMTADQSSGDLVITYAPTAAGVHVAYLNIINESHTQLNQSIKLEASCTDPSAQPVVTVTPSEVDSFKVLAGQSDQKTITVTSINCIDYVYLRVEHEKGEAFTVDASMLPKNTSREVIISFKPLEAGEYLSKLIIYSQSNEFENVEVILRGKGLEPSPETIDWQTDFVWNATTPLTYMNETFDDVEHNQTVLIDDWQNVADVDARPWWGFDASKTMVFTDDFKCAKASAYQSGKESTGNWDIWLVTPALDYKNAQTKVFAFDVMGQYLPEEGIEAALEIYYIEPGAPALFQNLTESFSIPQTSDENEKWVTFNLDLSPFASTIADVFHMGFRYVGPNGAAGVIAYYIDNVSWGKEQPVEGVQNTEYRIQTKKILRDGQVIIVRGGKEYNLLGIENAKH